MHDVLHALNEPSYLTMCETYRKIATDIRDALFTCCMHENYSCKQLDRDSTHYRVAIPELRSTPYALPKRRAIRTVINNIHKQYQCEYGRLCRAGHNGQHKGIFGQNRNDRCRKSIISSPLQTIVQR